MLVSYKWLQEYIEIPWDPEELADRLTMAGLEVEGLQPLAGDLSRFYVGYVESCEKHPRADKLQICIVDVGEQGKFKIVCGAPNVAAGQKVPVALEGAKLPNGMEIVHTEIRGEPSKGMICSQQELGISDDHEGIWVLPEDLIPGSPLAESIGLDDVILDVSVYANRPDCMSVLGIAREVAALTGGHVQMPAIDYVEKEQAITERTSITVENEELCPRYTASLLDGITLQPSPLWMQLRLRAAGMRPINNVVDITNYVMLETGQPLHAFDFDQLKENRIVVRTAREGEKMVSLDGVTRELTPAMLMICDAHDPKCIGGVMGGLDSEVTERTNTILLETANFAALNIRRTSRALGLSSESSARFEKGIDASGTMFANKRAIHLLQKFASAQAYAGHIDINSVHRELTTIEFDLNEMERILGITIPKKEIKSILESLEFTVDKWESELWDITVPSHRPDVEIQADVIEEIVRIWGLDKVPVSLPHDSSSDGGQSTRLIVSDQLRQILVGTGIQEALSYSFGREDNNDRLLRFNKPMIKIQNPISEDLIALRHSLLPGLLSAISLNSSRQQYRVALFEIGATYIGEAESDKQPKEEMQLGITLWGRRNPINWGYAEENYDFYDIKGILETLLPKSPELTWTGGKNPSFHPGRQGSIMFNGEEIAVYGEIHPAVQRNFRVPGRVYAAEIYFERILELFFATPYFAELPRFPAVERDLAVVIDKDQPVGDLMNYLQSLSGEILQEVLVFDVYEGKPIPEDKKSVAFSFRFQADRTLKDDEVNKIMDQCLQGLQSKYGADIR